MGLPSCLSLEGRGTVGKEHMPQGQASYKILIARTLSALSRFDPVTLAFHP